MNIIPFNSGEFSIRAVEIDGEPWFVGKDVCEALGYVNPADAISKHCKGVAKRYPLQTGGGSQDVRVLAEPDVLRLIVKSSLPGAEKFERWVFEEVLPSIRKTGRYSMVDQADVLNDPNALRGLLLGYTEKVLKLETEVEELKPKAEALDEISASDEDLTFTQAAKVLGVQRLFLRNWLQQHRWVYPQNGSWVAYQPHINNGDLRYKEARYTDENTHQRVIKPYCHITPKGLTKLAQLIGQLKKAA